MTDGAIPPDVIAIYEKLRREELFAQARAMTELGMSGADPNDPRIAELLRQGFEATKSHDDLKDWLKRHYRG